VLASGRVKTLASLLVVAWTIVGSWSCKSCHDEEEEEEQEAARDNYWRAQIAIVGQGTVRTSTKAFDCTSDGSHQTGQCGPMLLKFKELAPPLLQAVGAPGWRFDHWESVIRARDGAVGPRQGRMPDGRLYLNGFGYVDTGALETVTPVFVVAPDGGDDGSTTGHSRDR
jgi:hypothetical protein